MALVSPGVEVTIIDESNYIPAATNSVPYVLIATAQNKISGAGVGVAAGTLAANAGKVYLITSQRDLANTFGVPFFYKTSAGTPINGYELNEYGLLAAYSVLGVSNRAYVQRADVDLAELTASLVRPTGSPDDGTWWLDSAATEWGVFEWNATTGQFTHQTPLVITDTQYTYIDFSGDNVPISSYGNIGDYAVVAFDIHNHVYYKNKDNVWVNLGTEAWKFSWPTVQGTNSYTDSTLSGTLYVNGTACSVGPSGTLQDLVDSINAAFADNVLVADIDSSNRLVIYAGSLAEPDGSSAEGGGVVFDSTSTGSILTALGITAGSTYHTPALQISPSYTVPLWNRAQAIPRPTGSVWNMISPINQGMDVIMKRYDSSLGLWVTKNAPIYENDEAANAALDPTGGGKNIPANSLYIKYNVKPDEYAPGMYNETDSFRSFYRVKTGPTEITGTTVTPVVVSGNSMTVYTSIPGSSILSGPYTVSINGNTAQDFTAAMSAANIPYVGATVNTDGAIVISHSAGGVIQIQETSGTPLQNIGINTDITGVRYSVPLNTWFLSNWYYLSYTASESSPDQDPANGRKWYYSATDQVDIMIQWQGSWVGYKNCTNDARGYNLSLTDPNGPFISATAPTTSSSGGRLAYGDLWIDTSNLEMYPMIYRWQSVDGVNQWVAIDNSDQTTSNGCLFADARWASNGYTDPVMDPMPTIKSLLTSDYTDLDAPDPSLYPAGMLLWNTRRSGFNVKEFKSDYFTAANFTAPAYVASYFYLVGDIVLYDAQLYVCIKNTPSNRYPLNTEFWQPLNSNTWATVSGNRNNGSPYMGRQAVRQIVVAAMKSAIDTQDTLREEQVQFNLLACPQYPELIPNMVALNNERSNTGFVIGDTPLRLGPSGNELVDWATNSQGSTVTTEDSLVTSDPYLATFYPSCQTTDLGGSPVVQPPSHMMLRTIVRSDEVAYPWLAPAGTRRGIVDNAERIGYINGQTGEFVPIATGQAIRDVLYENKINPITFIPGVGITNYGNKTESAISSALDRINVSRLVAFIRGRLNEIGKTFVFEPNDQITRNEITNAINGLMIDLVAKRGIYDYLVVCDDSNNTPARIDRNELWVDIAIEPVKAVEFIYIPVRIKNTGEIAAGQIASSATV